VQSPADQRTHPNVMMLDTPISTHAAPMCLESPSDPCSASVPGLASHPACFRSDFTITLRLVERGKLGVCLGTLGNDTLVVNGILPGQAVHSWNRQCMLGNNVTRYVDLGDVLISVNGKTDCQEVLQECKDNLLLKITFGKPLQWGSFNAYWQDGYQ
jgi:hypothetical protein